MKFGTRLAMVISTAIPLLAMSSDSKAEDWTRSTAAGGTITRSVTGDDGHTSGTTTRAGRNGGTYTSSGRCASGGISRCARTYTATGPNGQTVTGAHATAVGPWGVRTAHNTTGPKGGRVVTFHSAAR